jgi:hypothetical protein
MRRAKPFIPPKVTVAAVTVGNAYDTIGIVESLNPQPRALSPAVANLVSP